MEDVMPETETTTQAPAPTGAATLYAKMARAMGKMKRIPKNGKNAHFNYEYATESDIADIVRETLAEVGIALFSEIIDVERAGTLTRVHMRYTFACTDTGATVERLWVGEADDRQDKGVSKAVTLATKYFLKTTFVISTGDPADDPDSGLGAPDPKPAPSAPKSANKPAPKPRGKQTEPASAPADDLEQRAKNFIAFAQKEYEMSVDEIKKVLGIKERLSEFDWSQGTVVASAKIDAWLNGSPDTKQPAGVTA